MITSRGLGVQFHDGIMSDAHANRAAALGQQTDVVAESAALVNQYAFTGVERTGAVFAYDITDPTAPKFVRHTRANAPSSLSNDDEAGEFDTESVIFVGASESPLAGSAPLRIVRNGISGTIGVFSVSAA